MSTKTKLETGLAVSIDEETHKALETLFKDVLDKSSEMEDLTEERRKIGEDLSGRMLKLAREIGDAPLFLVECERIQTEYQEKHKDSSGRKPPKCRTWTQYQSDISAADKAGVAWKDAKKYPSLSAIRKAKTQAMAVGKANEALKLAKTVNEKGFDRGVDQELKNICLALANGAHTLADNEKPVFMSEIRLLLARWNEKFVQGRVTREMLAKTTTKEKKVKEKKVVKQEPVKAVEAA